MDCPPLGRVLAFLRQMIGSGILFCPNQSVKLLHFNVCFRLLNLGKIIVGSNLFSLHSKKSEILFKIRISFLSNQTDLLNKVIWFTPPSVEKFIALTLWFVVIFSGTSTTMLALQIQWNLYKTTTLGTSQKWSPWAGGRLIKHLYKTATKQMRSSLAGF